MAGQVSFKGENVKLNKSFSFYLLLTLLIISLFLVAGAILSPPALAQPEPGINWVQQNSGTDSSLISVAWCGRQFVAVGNEGTIITSPDGIKWTERDSGTDEVLSDVTWGGDRFVAVGCEGTVLTSQDGINWTRQDLGTNDRLHSIAWSGSHFAAVGWKGVIFTSQDGVNWSQQSTGRTWTPDLFDITWGNNQFVAVGLSGNIFTSSNGINWVKQSPGMAWNPDFYGVTWDGNNFVAVGNRGIILTSPDGFTWKERSSGTDRNLGCVSWGGKGFVVTGEPTGDSGIILTSADGINWTESRSSSTNWFAGVTWGNNRFVVVGRSGTVLSSRPDENTVEKVQLMANPPEHGFTGQDLLFTAQVTAGTEDAEFAFYYKLPDRNWKLARPYDTDPTWEIRTRYSGELRIGVLARAVGSDLTYEAMDDIDYKINVPKPVDVVGLRAFPFACQVSGEEIRFIAEIWEGSENAEFAFYYRLPERNWTLARPYRTDPIWEVDTRYVGEVEIGVTARSVGSEALYQAKRVINYTIIEREYTDKDKELELDDHIQISDEKQSFITEDNVGLIVGPGFVDKPTRVTVHKYPEGMQIQRTEEFYQPATIYSFAIEGMEEFDQPVELQFPWPEGYGYDENIQVGRWVEGIEKDIEEQGWQTLPYNIDEEENLIIVPVNHFSDFALLREHDALGLGYRVLKTANFRINYHVNDRFEIGCESVSSNTYTNNVARYLEDYFESYKAIGLKVPEGYDRIFRRGFRNAVWLAPGSEQDAYSVYRERITYSTTDNNSWDELKATVGHELFHRIQHYGYLSGRTRFSPMHRARAVVEITAEYAGYRLLMDRSNNFYDHCLLSSEYALYPSLDLMSSQNGQYYAMARFLDFMIRANENPNRAEVFMGIWNAIVNGSGNRIDDFFEAVMQGTEYSFIEDALLDFLREAITDEEYNKENEFAHKAARGIADAGYYFITLDYSSEDGILYSGEIEIDDDRAFSLATIYAVENLPEDRSGDNLVILVEYEDISSGAYVDQFNTSMKNRFPKAVKGGLEKEYRLTPVSDSNPITSLVLGHDTALLTEGTQFIVYGHKSDDSVKITIRDAGPGLSIDPEEVETEFDPRGMKTIDFDIKIDNIPEYLETVDLHWNFGDGRSGSTGEQTVTVGGESELVLQKSHTYQRDEEISQQEYRVEVYITAEAFTPGAGINPRFLGEEMARAEAKVRFVDDEDDGDEEDEVTVRIKGPRVTYYDLPEGTTEVTHTFKAKADVPGDYIYRWDFDDGPDAIKEGSAAEVNYTYRDLDGAASHPYLTYHPSLELYDPNTEELLDEDTVKIQIRIIREDESEGEYDFRLLEDQDALYIRGYSGVGGFVTIPSEAEFGGEIKPVRKVGQDLEGQPIDLGWNIFTDITGVAIPESITAIRTQVFVNNLLEEVTIPSSVTFIGSSAFRANRLSKVVIPDSVIDIRGYAFAENRLEEVDIPKNLTSLEAGVFSDNQLEEIQIPGGVTRIGRNAFRNNQLSTLIIPGSVEVIEELAFYNNQLVSLTLPYGLNNIGSQAFAMNKLSELVIPGSVKEISHGVFSNNNLKLLKIQDGVEEIGSQAFWYNNLKHLTIPGSVLSIGNHSFNSNQLIEVTIKDGVTSIGRLAFARNKLTEITIPASVTTIGDRAFAFNEARGEDFIIYGAAGSAAEEYANKFGHTFIAR